MKTFMLLVISLVFLFSCGNNENSSDAYGNFEADEIIISSELNGRVTEMSLDEGSTLKKLDKILQIDTTQLYFQKLSLIANSESVFAKIQDVSSQLEVYQKKLEILNIEKNRVSNLIKSNAATQKQYDDIRGEIESTQKQMEALKVKLTDANRGILSQNKPILEQVKIIDDQISRASIHSPIDGTIINKYINQDEFARVGAPLIKIANTNKMYLKAYIDGKNLNKVKIGASAEVFIDIGNNDFKKYTGKITYVSDKAEFTPKIVQTKEQRVNLVYSVKILVENDGSIKIGMPGEVKF